MNTIEERARNEWERYCHEKRIGQKDLYLECEAGIGEEEWYQIQVKDRTVTIRSGRESGFLYGIFRLIEHCRLNRDCLEDWETMVKPKSKLRMLWSWGRIGGTYRHAPFQNIRSMINQDSMIHPEQSPEMMRFLRHAASMGVNGLALTHELHHSEIPSFDQHGFRPYYKEIRFFADYLKQWGIDLYLYTAAAPERDWTMRTGKRDCAFDPAVKRFTKDFIDELFTEIPELKGLLIAGGLGGYAGGHLYDCDCPYCRGKTHTERVREQILLYANALSAWDKKLVYTLTTDNPFTMDREVETICSLAETLPDNTILSFKDCFHDFEDLRYPEHPIFSHLIKDQKKTDRKLAVEYQLFPEMRGKESILSNVTERWRQLFQMADECGIPHVIGIIETHPADFHPSMADWYSFGALAEDPSQSADEILKRWGRLNYPWEMVDPLCMILKKSYEAAGKVLYAGGVQCGIHGMIISDPRFICDIMNDTWCGIPKKPFGYLGNDDRIGDLYTEERKEELKNDAVNRLFAEMRPVDETLKQLLLEEKEEGIRLYEEIHEEWKKAGESWKEKGEAYGFLLGMIEKNCGDARRFFKYMELFLDWQMECGSTDQIREAEKQYVHTRACCSLHTCDLLFGMFLKNLYALVRKNGEEEKSRTLPQYSEIEAKLL